MTSGGKALLGSGRPPIDWPIVTDRIVEEMLPERRAKVQATRTTTKEPEELLRFSSLSRLMRITAWCRRWLRRGRTTDRAAEPDPVPGECLSTAELDDARLRWIRRIHAATFQSELIALQHGRILLRSNPLNHLIPFLDPQGLLRVGGRLKHALLAYDERHPIILPTESHFTRLVVDACHARCMAESS